MDPDYPGGLGVGLEAEDEAEVLKRMGGFRSGLKVVIHGLQERTDLNGKSATLTVWYPEYSLERWQVNIQGTHESVLVAKRNLQLAPVPPSPEAQTFRGEDAAGGAPAQGRRTTHLRNGGGRGDCH